jgi:hypothetical protein
MKFLPASGGPWFMLFLHVQALRLMARLAIELLQPPEDPQQETTT